jgi:hypothetical protein
MARSWFYFGGLVPECWSSTLKVADSRLYGRRGGEYCEISPTDIVKVNEYGGGNAFILIETADGRFHVGVMSESYDDVARVLGEYVGSSFRRRLVHRMNVLLYRKQFGVGSLIRSLRFRRRG